MLLEIKKKLAVSISNVREIILKTKLAPVSENPKPNVVDILMQELSN